MIESTYKGYQIRWYQRPPPYDCEAEIWEGRDHIETTDTLIQARAFIDEREGTPPEAPEQPTRDVTWRGTKYQIKQRDGQKERLYRAEREAFAGVQDTFLFGLSEAQRYANSVVKSATWARLRRERGFSEPVPSNLRKLVTERKRKGVVEIEFGQRDCTATAYPAQWRIKLPAWAWNKHVVLHELAHIICGSGVGHHWIFARAFDDLVSRFMGYEQAKKLRAAYRKHGVKRAPPRVMSAEAKAALAARGSAALEAWKAAKAAKEDA